MLIFNWLVLLVSANFQLQKHIVGSASSDGSSKQELNPSSINYLYTINITIGTPPQQSQFLVDTTSEVSYVFRESSYLGQKVDSFYNASESSTSYTISTQNITKFVLGFSIIGNLKSDVLCLNEDFCYTTQFVSSTLLESHWLNYYELTNIGGILGLYYNDTEVLGSSLWRNSTITAKEFAIALRPDLSDWSWNPDAPVLEESSSYLMLGALDLDQISFETINEQYSTMVLLLSDDNTWSFQLKSITFGSIQTQNLAYNYLTVRNVQINPGFNGFGLPQSDFERVMGLIRVNNPNITCKIGQGLICYSNTSCTEFYDQYKDWVFNLTFQAQVNVIFQIPFSALLRQTQPDQCDILLIDIGLAEVFDYYILGDVFTQLYWTQFIYEPGFFNNQPLVIIGLQEQVPQNTALYFNTFVLDKVFSNTIYAIFVIVALVSICVWFEMVVSDYRQNKREKQAQIEYQKLQDKIWGNIMKMD